MKSRRQFVTASLAVSALTTSAQTPDERARLNRNKASVKAFYEMALNDGKPTEAIARYAGSQYIQHNPEVADGKDGFIAYFNAMHQRYGANKRLEIKRLIAEDEFVVAHCKHWFREWHGESYWATMDIFHMDGDGKIIEHWDVMQKVPSRMAHQNGMF
jgi:predicted SnoaL-like aldol condensation-catalyzing enzyme